MAIDFPGSAKEAAILIATCCIVLPLLTSWAFFRNLFTIIIRALFGHDTVLPVPAPAPRATLRTNNSSKA